MKSLIIAAPAKVNLVLRVLNKRPDGYHDLFMIMEKLSLADDIFMEEIESGIKLTIEGESDSGMQAEKNLAYRAAKAFREAAGEKRGVNIRLTKRIPIAAGLGGGSSDAASVLRGLNQLWQKEWSSNRLAALGAKLGGDVPFFCFDGPAIVEGIGDRVTTLQKLPNMFFLLINPGFSVSTPWVYQHFDHLEIKGHDNSKSHEKIGDLELTPSTKGASYRRPISRNGKGVTFRGFRDVVASLENDLEGVTLAAYSEVREIRDFLIREGADGVLMSGSGPTVFGVFANAEARDCAFTAVKKRRWKVFATDNIRDA